MFRVVFFLVIIVAPCVLARNDIIKRQKALFSCLTNPTGSIKSDACVKKCISEKLGLIDASGNPIESNYDVIERKFLHDCDIETQQDDPCLRVDAFELCLDKKCEEHQELMKTQCREETNYKDSSAENSLEVACYHKCLAVKNGVLTEDGDIVIEALKDFTGEDGDFEESLGRCEEDYQNLTGCEKVMIVLRCVIENSTGVEDVL